MSRRRAREDALRILYLRDLCGAAPASAEEVIWGGDTPDGEIAAFARELVSGVVGKIDDIDSHIASRSENWTLERMPVVDKNILRIAVYEIVYSPSTPAKVAINEAIEIAKTFSGDKSTMFINGILDKIKNSAAAPKAAVGGKSSAK